MKTHVVLFVSLLIIFLVGCQVEEVQEIAPEEPIVEKVEVVPSISFISLPTSVKENEPLAVSWKVESNGPLTAVHTAIHYDSTSHPGIFTTEIGPQDSGYNILTKEYASGEFLVPGEFSTQISIPKGISNMYLRAHAIIGGKNYWTDETTVDIEKVVIKPIVPPAPKIKEFVIEGDDDKLFPDSITVKKGDKVKITFLVRTNNVYFGGLDFRSDVWGTTDKIKKGGNATVEFTADKSFEFKSYWPASNRLKATGQIIVE